METIKLFGGKLWDCVMSRKPGLVFLFQHFWQEKEVCQTAGL
jgi:hypothetical protein